MGGNYGGFPVSSLDAIERAESFSRHEFPETVEGCSPELIDALQRYRNDLGQVIHPSRHPSGWHRANGNPSSRHYHGDAGDIFPTGDPLRAFLLACRYFGGVGIYFDTRKTKLQPGPMLHCDLRNGLTVWARNEGRYIYPARGGDDYAEFWFLFAQYAEQA